LSNRDIFFETGVNQQDYLLLCLDSQWTSPQKGLDPPQKRLISSVATMLNFSAWIVLFCTVAISNSYTVSADAFDEMCCLCDECYFPAPGRGDLNVDKFGTTCYEQLLSMADTENSSTNGSKQCAKQIDLHRERCCDSAHDPIDIAIAP
jgi:hypothetical protein